MTVCVLFRTRYGGSAGYGHIKRCLSMANALRERGVESVFLLDSLNKDVLLEVKKYKYHYFNDRREDEEGLINQ